MSAIPVILLIFLMFFGCGNPQGNENDCPLGQPTAIFSDTLKEIQSQKFEVTGQESLETVQFKNGVELELAQRGCEEISQEFQFRLLELADQNKTIAWVEAGVEQFKFLATLGEQFSPFFIWATSIEEQKQNFAFNTPQELAPGFFVTFNKVAGSDYSILIVKLHTEKK